MRNIIITYILLVLTGCYRSDHQHEEHDHERCDHESGQVELEPVSFTEYSDNHELFAEISPLIKGHASEVIAHFTTLDNYKPITSGDLTAIFSVGGKKTERKYEQLARPGIYIFEINPEHSGHGTLTLKINSEGNQSEFVLKMKVYESKKNYKAATKHVHQHAHSDEIVFLREQAWNTDFNIFIAEKKAFSSVLQTSGEIQSASKELYKIVAKHSGIIVFEQANLVPGMRIQPEDDIMLIASDDILHDNFEVKFDKTRLDFEKARLDFERAEKLYKDKIMPEKEYLELSNRYENIKRDFELLKAHFKPGGHHIHLKKSGFVNRILVSDGQYVEIGQPLLEILNNDRLILKAEVSQKNIGFLSGKLSAIFKVDYAEEFINIDDFEGRLLSIGQTVRGGNTLLPVYFEFRNPGTIIPGSFAEIYISKPASGEKIIVPYQALIEDKGFYYLIVQQEGETYEKREVKIGVSNGKMIEVTKGLKENEVVVTKGAYRVYLASLSSELPEHAHVH